MTDAGDSRFDSLFHSCALAAFVERTVAAGGWPDAKSTRQLACRYCEEDRARIIDGGDAALPAPPLRASPRLTGPERR